MTAKLVKSKSLALGFFAAIATTPLLLGGLPVSAQTSSPSPFTEPTSSPSPFTEPTSSPSPTSEPGDSSNPTTEPTSSPSPTSEPSDSSNPTTEPTSSPSPTSEQSPDEPQTTKPSTMLKVGSQGEEVKKVQEFLKKQGFFQGETTGIFGEKTRSAVIAFQKSKGLSADGVVGPGTLAAMGLGL